MSEFVYWAKEFEEKNQNTDWSERDYMMLPLSSGMA